MTSAALLVIIGKPIASEYRQLILDRITEGLSLWDVSGSGVDLAAELSILAEGAPIGEEGLNGERIIEHTSEAGVQATVLIFPHVATVTSRLRALLLCPAQRRLLVYAGHGMGGTGDWLLQDDLFTVEKFTSVTRESDVENALRQQEGSELSLYVFTEALWSSANLAIPGVTVSVNPAPPNTGAPPEINAFLDYLRIIVKVKGLKELLQPSDVVGNIRFSRPTLYVFPGAQGDSALFGISGFNLLVNGGYENRACFWDFTRHLDSIDGLLITHLSSDNLLGVASVLRRKAIENVHPEIGHVFLNAVTSGQKSNELPVENGDLVPHSLLVDITQEGSKLVENLQHIGQKPHPLTGTVTGGCIEPINLYHKVGQGTLDMYVLNPMTDSKDLADFYSQWNKQVKTFTSSKSVLKVGGKEGMIPLPHMVSICALLVWRPSDPSDNITRILFPGNTPQNKVFEGLDKLKSMDIFQSLSCTQSSLSQAKVNKKSPVGKPSAKPADKITSKRPTPPKIEPVKKNVPEKKAPAASNKVVKEEKNNKKAAVAKTSKTSSPSPKAASPVPSPKSISPVPTPAPASPVPTTPGKEHKVVPVSLVPDVTEEIDVKPEIDVVAAVPDEVPAPREGWPDEQKTEASDKVEDSSSSFETNQEFSSQQNGFSMEAPDSLPEPSYPAEQEAAQEATQEAPSATEEKSLLDDFTSVNNTQDDESLHAVDSTLMESAPAAAVDDLASFDMPTGQEPVEDRLPPDGISPSESHPTESFGADSSPFGDSYNATPADVTGAGKDDDLADLGIYDDEADEAAAADVADLAASAAEKEELKDLGIYDDDEGEKPETKQAWPAAEQGVFDGAAPEGLPEPDFYPECNLPDPREQEDWIHHGKQNMDEQQYQDSSLGEQQKDDPYSYDSILAQGLVDPVTQTQVLVDPVTQTSPREEVQNGHANQESQDDFESYKPLPKEEEDFLVQDSDEELHSHKSEDSAPMESARFGEDSGPVSDCLTADLSLVEQDKSQVEDSLRSLGGNLNLSEFATERSSSACSSPSLGEQGVPADDEFKFEKETLIHSDSADIRNGNITPVDDGFGNDLVSDNLGNDNLGCDNLAISLEEKSMTELTKEPTESQSDSESELCALNKEENTRENNDQRIAFCASPEPSDRRSPDFPSQADDLLGAEKQADSVPDRAFTDLLGETDSASFTRAAVDRVSESSSRSGGVDCANLSQASASMDSLVGEDLPLHNTDHLQDLPVTDSLEFDAVRDSLEVEESDLKNVAAPSPLSLPVESCTGDVSPDYRPLSPEEDMLSRMQSGFHDDVMTSGNFNGLHEELGVKPTSPLIDGITDGPHDATSPSKLNPFNLGEAGEEDSFFRSAGGVTPQNTVDERDSLERDFDPMKEWGHPLGLPAPPPPTTTATKKPAAKPATPKPATGAAAAKKEPAKKAPTAAKAAPEKKPAASTATARKTTTATKPETGGTPKKDVPNGRPAARSSLANGKPSVAEKAATEKKPPTGASAKAAASTATKTATTTIKKARPSTAPVTKAAPPTKPAPAAKTAVKTDDKPKTSTARRVASAPAAKSAPAKPAAPIVPFYVDLTYIPNHGNPHYVNVDFFKRIRARYYVLSALNPSPSVLNALLEAKASWENSDTEVTLIPTYDTDTLRHWMGLNQEQLAQLKVQVAPSASRCTIQLQDHETSCAAYRLEF